MARAVGSKWRCRYSAVASSGAPSASCRHCSRLRRQYSRSAPDFLHVPEGGVHGFRNDSGAAASMLILFAPGAPRETYFGELADISSSGRVLSDEEWTDLFARHDQYLAT